MNKLISKNPVQRFKEGGYRARHKEERGQARFNAKFRKTGQYPGRFLDDMLQGERELTKGVPYKDESEIYIGPYKGSWLTYSSLIGDHNDQNREIYDRGVTQVQQMEKSNPQETVPLDTQNSYATQNRRYTAQQPVAGARKRAYYWTDPTDGSKYLIGTDGSKTLIKKGVTQTNVTSTPVNNTTSTNTNNTTSSTNIKSANIKSAKSSVSSKGSSFAKAFKEARAKGLREFMWNGQRKNTMVAGATREQWLKNLGTKAPQQKEVVASNQPAMEKVQTQTVVPSSQEIGDWTQALIEAQKPQQVTPTSFASSNYVPTSEDIQNWMQQFKFKKGGSLISKNPVTRFKQRNFR